MQPLHRSIEVLDWIPIHPSGVIPWFDRSTLYATRILLKTLACSQQYNVYTPRFTFSLHLLEDYRATCIMHLHLVLHSHKKLQTLD